MITCKACGEHKPPEEFHRQSSAKTGRQPVCRPCAIAAVIQWQRENPDRLHAKQRKSDLKRRYGITVERYDELLAAQGGACAICKKTHTRHGSRGTPIPLVVDHCHETGAIRGLLCHTCNRGIGYLGDTLEGLLRARSYLTSSRPRW